MDFFGFLAASVAFLVAILCVPPTIFLARKIGVLDQPNARKVHVKPIPRIGGLAIFAGFLSGICVLAAAIYWGSVESTPQFHRQLVGLLAACMFVWMVGFVDDILTISSRFKLLTLLAAAALVSASGSAFGTINLAGVDVVEFRWLAWLTTVFWITAVVVAVNFIDGLDGLAAGLVALSAAVLSIVLLGAGQLAMAMLPLSLLGALLGFLVFNRHPARIFMGDCGSMLIGMCIASLMLIANPSIGSMRAIVLPSLALSIPLLDGTLTFFRRHYEQRRSIFSAERGHIHHRLLDRGLKHHQAVLFLYAVSVGAVAVGFLSLQLEGVATFGGLSLLIPLLWGAFKFAGSVRTDAMLMALRSRRDLDRASKGNREKFEAMQLEFEKIDAVGQWWHSFCKAAEAFDFKTAKVQISRNGKQRELTWSSSREELSDLESLRAVIPVPDTGQFGGNSLAEVDIAITKTVELAGDRLALFSRLITENSLLEIRRRERTLHARPKSGRHANGQSLSSMNVANEEDEPRGPFGNLRVALVHDFFYTYCGAERVVEQLINVVPHCDVFALFDFLPEEERGFLKGKAVTTTFLQNMPLARNKHRAYLPLMPLAIEQLDLSGYDLVISSSYVAAKGVITGPDQLHVCYCHSPVRYAWDLQHQYLKESKLGFGPKGLLARAILHYVRQWDLRSANGVDHFIANSQFVGRRISKVYRRDASVIHPPVDADFFVPSSDDRQDYYVAVSRMVPYKRTDLIVDAFAKMPERKLKVIGTGPDMEKIRQRATPNIELLGFQEQDSLLQHLQHAKAFVFAAEEDFGIVPVEAMACGTPVIAYRKGGVTESVADQLHGLLYDEQTTESLIEAVERFEAEFAEDEQRYHDIRRHAQRFSNQRFRQRITEKLGQWVVARWPSQSRTRGPAAAVHSRPLKQPAESVPVDNYSI